MPRPWFLLCLVAYLMKYAHFSLRKENSPPSAYIRVQPIAAARGTRQTDGRTDGQTDTGPHFIMPIYMDIGGIKMAVKQSAARSYTSIFSIFPTKQMYLYAYNNIV